MAFFHFRNVRVAGIAAGVPKKIVNNLTCQHQISKDYDNAAFVKVTGVEKRHYDTELTTSDLCFAAAKQLLADLHWDAKEIDAIIMVSQTLDFILPATACIMQDKLGCGKECYAEDIQLGCSGWTYGMSNVASLLQNGDIRRALLMAGDARGHMIDKSKDDPLFGFAGTVTALEYEQGNDGLKCHYGTDGSGYEAIITPGGGSRMPFNEQSLLSEEIEGRQYNALTTRMNGMDVFSFGITTAPKSIKKLGEHYGFNYLNADYFIFHQANMKMNQMIEKKLKLPKEKVPECMSQYGNTSSASIPLTIVTQLQNEAKDKDLKFICCGFGVGLSWGTIAFETKNLVISNLVEVESNEHML